MLLRAPAHEPTEPAVDAILRRRAERLRRSRAREQDEDDTTAPDRFWVARVRVAGEPYALPLASVRGAMPLRMVSPVPLAPPFVLGILRFRGEPVVAMSLFSLLGVRGWRVDPEVLIVVETGPRRIALDCEEIPQADAIAQAALDQARLRQPGAAVVSVETRDGSLSLIDDIEALIRTPSEAPGAR